MASIGASNHVARVLSAANHLANVEPESRIALSWRRCLIDHKLDPARHGHRRRSPNLKSSTSSSRSKNWFRSPFQS